MVIVGVPGLHKMEPEGGDNLAILCELCWGGSWLIQKAAISQPDQLAETKCPADFSLTDQTKMALQMFAVPLSPCRTGILASLSRSDSA